MVGGTYRLGVAQCSSLVVGRYWCSWIDYRVSAAEAGGRRHRDRLSKEAV